jgi:hypothetical protein
MELFACRIRMMRRKKYRTADAHIGHLYEQPMDVQFIVDAFESWG